MRGEYKIRLFTPQLKCFFFKRSFKTALLGYNRDPQIWPTPAEFSSNPNQTHLSMLIRVFKIIRKSQVGEFDQGWS